LSGTPDQGYLNLLPYPETSGGDYRGSPEYTAYRGRMRDLIRRPIGRAISRNRPAPVGWLSPQSTIQISAAPTRRAEHCNATCHRATDGSKTWYSSA